MGKPLKDWTFGEVQEECLRSTNCYGCSFYRGEAEGCTVRRTLNSAYKFIWPSNWELRDSGRLTEPELAICRATGAAWVTMDKGGCAYVSLWILKPTMTDVGLWVSDIQSLGLVHRDKFPSVCPGDCVEVPDG